VKGSQLDEIVVAEQEALATISQEAKRKSNYTLPAYWLEPDGTHIALKKGEELSLRDLLYGLLICSGNDAANVIAQCIGGTIPQFIEQMNAYLKEVGCSQTTFYNPHGLHDPRHQTTAYDLAILTKEGLKNPIFCEIVSSKRFMRPKTNKQKATTLLQGNRLLRPGKLYYSKAIGVKTGYHSKAKNNLVAAARFDNRTLIAVLLGCGERTKMFEEAVKLFEAAFNQPKIQKTFLKAGQQKFTLQLPHANQLLQTYLATPLVLDYYPAEDPMPKCLLYWNQDLVLPIQKDQQVGALHLIAQTGEVLKEAPLLALEEVNLTTSYKILAFLSNPLLLLVLIGVGILGFCFLIKRKGVQ
jgi:serine-type D-Ala-D-Ala carboxypeptidase (penicillin-binding protein 5/6)